MTIGFSSIILFSPLPTNIKNEIIDKINEYSIPSNKLVLMIIKKKKHRILDSNGVVLILKNKYTVFIEDYIKHSVRHLVIGMEFRLTYNSR